MAEPTISAAEQFLAEGLFKYAEAHATVNAFEAAIRDRVVEIAGAEAQRLPGTKSKPAIGGNGVCYASGKEGRVAYVHFPGELGGENVTWEMGVWWQHPSQGKHVHLYVECYKGPPKFKSEQWAKAPKSDSRWEAYVSGLSWRIVSGESLAKGFRVLLDEVARQSHDLSKKA